MFRTVGLMLVALVGLAVSRPQELQRKEQFGRLASKPAAVIHHGACTMVGKTKTPNIAVIIYRGCFTKNMVEVAFLVFSKDSKLAINEGVPAMIKLLGYKPKLSPLFFTIIVDKQLGLNIPLFVFIAEKP
jgi:hypothetical protein